MEARYRVTRTAGIIVTFLQFIKLLFVHIFIDRLCESNHTMSATALHATSYPCVMQKY